MKAIILDRDGVINQDSPDFIKSPAEWHPIPGSIEAIACLCKAGYRVFIATNQSGIARGLFDTATLDAIHSKLIALIQAAGGRIDGIAYCPHGPADYCDCRKPKPGLFFQLAATYNIDLSQTFSVGDAWRDIEAGRAAGCRPLLVRTGKGLETLKEHQHELEGIRVCNDLQQALDVILSNKE